MTYSRNITLKTILLHFINKNIIDVRQYLQMLNNAGNYQLIEDFLIQCIINFDISYKNYPLNYKNDPKFLKQVCEVRPKVVAELEKENKKVYYSLFSNTSIEETDKIAKKLPKKERSKIVKLNFGSASKQVG